MDSKFRKVEGVFTVVLLSKYYVNCVIKNIMQDAENSDTPSLIYSQTQDFYLLSAINYKLFSAKNSIYFVERDTPRIVIILKSWIYDLAISIFKFEDFSYKVPKALFSDFIIFYKL